MSKLRTWDDVRLAIRERLAILKDDDGAPRNLSWLGDQLERRNVIRKNFLYEFMRGEKDTTSDNVMAIFKVLGLRITELPVGERKAGG